jgi:16S rRNA (guanine527-N7)-methyltransferase
MTAALLERWLEDVVRTPGLTGIGDLPEARRFLVNDALRAQPLLQGVSRAVVDVGSGGGSPGLPLAVALPELEFVLLEANRRKCAFLERFAAELPNVQVVQGRAEEQPLETFGAALAKALAKPPVAIELCLPLVGVGGMTVLWIGSNAERAPLASVASRLGATLEEEQVPGLLVVRKLEPTPPGFPRRPGMAKKRPLS